MALHIPISSQGEEGGGGVCIQCFVVVAIFIFLSSFFYVKYPAPEVPVKITVLSMPRVDLTNSIHCVSVQAYSQKLHRPSRVVQYSVNGHEEPKAGRAGHVWSDPTPPGRLQRRHRLRHVTHTGML